MEQKVLSSKLSKFNKFKITLCKFAHANILANISPSNTKPTWIWITLVRHKVHNYKNIMKT